LFEESRRNLAAEAIVGTVFYDAWYGVLMSDSFLQASPVNEAEVGPGFSGTYHGAQGKSKAIFALLEQIQDDFDRTVRKTSAAEEEAHRDFVEYTESAKSSIASKETQAELCRQDLTTTKLNIATKQGDLESAVALLDGALKELEELKPTCIDTGMSFADRVKKRESEMAALRHAMCILDKDDDDKLLNCDSTEAALADAMADEAR